MTIASLGYLLLGPAAREINESPKRLSDLLGRRQFPPELTFVEGGRRFVHRDLLPTLKAELQRKPGRPRNAGA